MSKSLSVSVVKATDKTNLKHNNREMSKNEMRANQHIDTSMSDTNIYLVQEDLKDLYEKEFGEALENYNSKQKRKDRKIDNYYDHISNSKKTAEQQEMIFQVGDKDSMQNADDRKMAIEILEQTFHDFKKRNPQLKIFNAVIHNDEATPHMHINFVPVAEGYKRGLEKQVSFDRAIVQQDDNLDKERPFAEWRANEVFEIEKLLNENNINRKIVGTNSIADVNTYKKQKDLVNKVADLERLEARVDQLDRIRNITVKNAKNFVEKTTEGVKPVILSKDMVQIPQKDLESLKKSFLHAIESNAHARAEVKEVNSAMDKMQLKMDKTNELSMQLKSENLNLKIETNELKKNISDITDLKRNNQNYEKIYQSFKPYLNKHHDFLQKTLDKIPMSSKLIAMLKGYVSASLTDRNFEKATNIAINSYNKGHDHILIQFNIGRTKIEHTELNKPKLKEVPKKPTKELSSISDLKANQKAIDQSNKSNQEIVKKKSRGMGR